MSDEPPSSEDAVPMARPVAPPADPVGQARAIPWIAPAGTESRPMYLGDAAPRAVWLDLGLFVCGVLICYAPLALLATLMLFLKEDLDERMLNVMLLPVQAAAWITLVALILKMRGQSAASMGWVRGRLLVDVPLGFAAWVCALGAFFAFTSIIWVTWPAGFVELQGNEEAITEMLPPLHPAVLLGLQVLVGFYEELVFRGFLLTRLRRGLGSWWAAVLTSSLLFAVPHMLEQKAIAAIPLFGVGVVFAIFAIWRKSVVPAIIGHALFNACMLVGIYLTHPDWT